MKVSFKLYFSVAIFLAAITHQATAQQKINWSFWLNYDGKPSQLIDTFTLDNGSNIIKHLTIDHINISLSVLKKKGYYTFNVESSSKEVQHFFFSLKGNYTDGDVYSYTEQEKNEKIFRQSPHDPDNYKFTQLTKQELPLVAVKDQSGFWVALNDAPAFYDNYTTQWISPEQKEVTLSSGDNGKWIGAKPVDAKIEKYYHTLNPGQTYNFNGIIWYSHATNLNNLRKDALANTAKWKGRDTTRFAATSFASNYMLLRKNERKFSNFWVVPSIAYANKQYSRDSFWQSMVLPDNMQQNCYKNEAVQQSPGAERPLFALIFAYRVKTEGLAVNMEGARKSLKYIEAHTRDGKYYAHDDAKKDYQAWDDVVAFDEDDVITYNQGLLAVALLSAEKLGLRPAVSSQLAITRYQGMFNEAGGYFPLSEKKNLMAVDALVGDLLAKVFFNRSLLTSASVQRHFENITQKAKTSYGYKCSSLPNGDFAPEQAYWAENYPVKPGLGSKAGNYQHGGSWFLYDMLFLIDSYLDKANGAENELIWRGTLDFKLGGTYFEYINTVSGVPNKPNQGWNAAVYAIWKMLMEKKLVDGRLLTAIGNVK